MCLAHTVANRLFRLINWYSCGKKGFSTKKRHYLRCNRGNRGHHICPVISFNRGSASELVLDRKTGFLVHDLNGMVRCIPKIDEIDREATRMHVERNFSAPVMAEKYTKVYSRVITMSKGGSV